MTNRRPPPAPGPTTRPITTPSALRDAWRALVGPHDVRSRGLWLMLLDPDGVPAPRLIELTDLPERPTPADTDGLARFLRHVAGCRVAALLAHPGAGLPDAADRSWAHAVHTASEQADVHAETVHVVTARDITPLPREDLALDESA